MYVVRGIYKLYLLQKSNSFHFKHHVEYSACGLLLKMQIGLNAEVHTLFSPQMTFQNLGSRLIQRRLWHCEETT